MGGFGGALAGLTRGLTAQQEGQFGGQMEGNQILAQRAILARQMAEKEFLDQSTAAKNYGAAGESGAKAALDRATAAGKPGSFGEAYAYHVGPAEIMAGARDLASQRSYDAKVTTADIQQSWENLRTKTVAGTDAEKNRLYGQRTTQMGADAKLRAGGSGDPAHDKFIQAFVVSSTKPGHNLAGGVVPGQDPSTVALQAETVWEQTHPGWRAAHGLQPLTQSSSSAAPAQPPGPQFNAQGHPLTHADIDASGTMYQQMHPDADPKAVAQHVAELHARYKDLPAGTVGGVNASMGPVPALGAAPTGAMGGAGVMGQAGGMGAAPLRIPGVPNMESGEVAPDPDEEKDPDDSE